MKAHFAFNVCRQKLFDGFERLTAVLAAAGCRAIYLDGGFISDSPFPRDFDGCWDPTGVDPRKLDPVLFDYDNDRAAQKQKYGGEMFISIMQELASGKTFLDFFQIERTTGVQKGVVLISTGTAKVTP
ncbi:MAG: hypothetical protein WB760_08555 [Xanthobacteraceae bacterium]